MSKPFLLGLETSIKRAPFISTDLIYQLVGHNTGNLAFHYAINSHLGGALNSVSWGASIDEINSKGGLAILPAANQLGSHADYGGMAAKLSKLTVPIVVIGLGAQANINGDIPDVPQGTLEWVKVLSEHAPGNVPNIALRGNFTKQVLAHYELADRTVVTGCPTLFINPNPRLGSLLRSRLRVPRRVAVTAGHHRWKHLSRIEASLARMVTETRGSYVGQSPLEMVQLTRGEADQIDPGELLICRDYVAPELPVDEFIDWSRIHGNVFFDIPAWMEHYRHFDFVVGTRIHGVMLALQAGVPAMCIAHDSRTLELCRTMKVPHILSKDVQKGISREQMMDLFVFDAEEFDENRRILCNTYVNFMLSNNLAPQNWLFDVANYVK